MTAIVMNTLTAAVSEYDWTFAGLCATHAGNDSGLYLLGGDKDAGAKINAKLVTGKTLREGTLKNAVESAYLSIAGPAGSAGIFTVYGESDSWDYPVEVRQAGVSRAKTGRGIRENYLGFGYRNVDGAPFGLDRIEVKTVQSPQRRL